MGIPIIGDLIEEIGDLASEFIVDKDKKNELNVRLQELGDKANERYHEEMMAQINVNNTEAQHRSIFIAGWRPFVGWGCGAALVYNTLAAPMIELVARWIGWTGSMPVLDTAFLQTVLLAMLGVGAMRSYDKAKGTSDDTPLVGKKVKHVLAALPEKAPWGDA